jgi:hypothetical protein
MLVFGIMMPEDCPAKAVSCEAASITDEDEMDALDGLRPLLALVECLPIRPGVNEAAMANMMKVSVINGFFVLPLFMCITSPSLKDCSFIANERDTNHPRGRDNFCQL